MIGRLVLRGAAIAAVIGMSLLTAGGDQARRRPDTRTPSRPPAAVAHPARTVEVSRDLYVSPRGTPEAAGTLTDPLDLATALAANGPVVRGDHVWLRGGTYLGPFVSGLAGTSAAPIHVQSFPGERATIDGRAAPALAPLTVNGSDTVYQDLEVTNTSEARDHERGIGVNVFGPRVRLVNLIVHDTGNGIGLWSPAIDAEVYGSVIYNAGWQEHEIGKGHSIYVQNETGVKRITDNVLFNAYGFGIHAYTVQGRIDNLQIEGNVSFNHGLLAPNHEPKANILVGGWHEAGHPTLIDNFTYVASEVNGSGAELGYWAGCRDARVLRNYFAGGVPILLRRCSGVTMSGNRFLGAVDPDTVRAFPDNAYRHAGSGVDVFVRPNRYVQGRATIVVFNWSKQPTVAVDLWSAGLQREQRFEIRDVQNYLGPPVAAAVYVPGTAIAIPMTGEVMAPPIGTSAVPHTPAEFGVFIVLPAGRTPRGR